MMKTNTWIRAVAVAAVGAAFALPPASSAQTVDIFTEDFSAFNATTQFGDGVTFGVVLITNSVPFGTGAYVRYFDFNNPGKPETQGELSADITGPFRVSFQSVNQAVSNSASPAIRWRMANAGKSIASQNRTAFSLSWHADHHFSASYLSTSNTINSVETPPQSAEVHDTMVIGNASTNQVYSYTFAGVSRTLSPQSYDVFIDNLLLNSDPAFAGGLGFSVGVATEYLPELGIRRFGITSSSSTDVDPDVLFDNIFLTIGEPPTELPIASVRAGVADGFAFTSTSGTVYALQSSTNAMDAIPTWIDAGMGVTGNGAEQVLFDPNGFDSNKAYRVIEAP